jgi:hypothetical protein
MSRKRLKRMTDQELGWAWLKHDPLEVACEQLERQYWRCEIAAFRKAAAELLRQKHRQLELFN